MTVIVRHYLLSMYETQVAACDASAPSWQFLRSAWAQLQSQGRAAAGEEGAQLLWVISHAASRFPSEDAAALAKELLQVCVCMLVCSFVFVFVCVRKEEGS